MQHKNVALLFSGGMDSYIAYMYLTATGMFEKRHIIPLYINYHGEYCDAEQEVAVKLIPHTIVLSDVLNLSKLETGEKRYIPNRNLLMASIATNYSNTVMMAGLVDDNVGDKSKSFCRSASLVLSESLGRDIVFTSPFWSHEKADIVGWLLDVLGKEVALAEIMKTKSCYSKTELYCGKCPSCFRKMCALAYHDIFIPFTNFNLVINYYATRANYPHKRLVGIYKAYHHLLGDYVHDTFAEE